MCSLFLVFFFFDEPCYVPEATGGGGWLHLCFVHYSHLVKYVKNPFCVGVLRIPTLFFHFCFFFVGFTFMCYSGAGRETRRSPDGLGLTLAARVIFSLVFGSRSKPLFFFSFFFWGVL